MPKAAPVFIMGKNIPMKDMDLWLDDNFLKFVEDELKADFGGGVQLARLEGVLSFSRNTHPRPDKLKETLTSKFNGEWEVSLDEFSDRSIDLFFGEEEI